MCWKREKLPTWIRISSKSSAIIMQTEKVKFQFKVRVRLCRSFIVPRDQFLSLL